MSYNDTFIMVSNDLILPLINGPKLIGPAGAPRGVLITLIPFDRSEVRRWHVARFQSVHFLPAH